MSLKVDISICRVCLKSQKGINLFEDEELLKKFECITELKLQQNDRTPQILCDKCAVRLKIADDFRKEAISSDTQMRVFLGKVDDHFKEITRESVSVEKDEEGMTEDEIQMLIDGAEKFEKKSMKFLYTIQNELDSGDIVTEEHIGDFSQPSEDNFSEYIQEDVVSEDAFNPEPEQEPEEDQMLDENQQLEEVEDTMESNECTLDVKFPIRVISTDLDVESVKIKNERIHVCPICNKDFSTKTNLMRHKITHDGVKPYKCEICGNTFTQNGSLKQHMFIHTGERPHKCEVCGRGFTQGKSLVFHMRRHTGEKPYPCDVCGLTFRQKDGLKRHKQLKHSESPSKVYLCSVCNKVLQTKYSYAFHMKKHLALPKTDSTDCDICSRSFPSKKTLQHHRRKHLADDPPFNFAAIIIEQQ